jgi:hypothetical protein
MDILSGFQMVYQGKPAKEKFFLAIIHAGSICLMALGMSVVISVVIDLLST